MPSEAEKRLHRCCLAGHRPEKLDISEEEVQAWLRKQIDAAIGDGYRTFLCGVEPGTDIIAAQIIREKKEKDPELHMICAVPWPDYEEDWNFIWQVQYRFLLEQADIVKYFAKAKTEDAGIFRKRREWMPAADRLLQRDAGRDLDHHRGRGGPEDGNHHKHPRDGGGIPGRTGKGGRKGVKNFFTENGTRSLPPGQTDTYIQVSGEKHRTTGKKKLRGDQKYGYQ